MTPPCEGSERRPETPGEIWKLIASAGVAMAPYVIYHHLFTQLFWFGDEFDLIDQIDRIGFWHWACLPFAENFVPLFKILWGAAVFGFGGSYAAMIAIVWLTHAFNVALLGRLMRTCGLSWTAVFFAQVIFGLTSANCETLGWSVQWSAMLSVTFMLVALEGIFRASTLSLPLGWVAASGLSFSRGVLTGPVVSIAYLMRPGDRGSLRRIALALAILLPALAIACLIYALADGNQHSMGGHIAQAAVFGLWYFLLNPLFLIFSVESWGWRTTVALGAIKVALYCWALLRSRGRPRRLLVALLVFDLGNAALLGIGRYHTGLAAAVSSRYQYAALIAAAPCVGFLFSRQMERFSSIPALGRVFAGALLLAVAAILCSQWGGVLTPFAQTRGTYSRRILLEDFQGDPEPVPGIPGLPMDRAKQLIAKYRLH
jgi:hypothetical protein